MGHGDQKRGWTRTALRWLGLAAVFLLTLELSARVEDAVVWGAPLLEPYSHSRLTVTDSLGTRNRPGYRFEKWGINSLGFRGPEIEARPPAGVVRVGVLGASETFGLFETEGGEFPARLGAVLDSLEGGRFQVVNLGMAGLPIPAMMAYYERLVRPIRPELVLIYPSPSFYLDAVPPREWGRGPVVAGEASGEGAASILSGIPEWRLTGKARVVLRRFIPQRLQSEVRERRIGELRRARGEGWVWEEVPVDRMEMMGEELGELVEAIRASGAEPVLVTHSNRALKPPEELTPEDLHHITAILNLNPRATPPVLMELDLEANRVIRRVGRELGVHVVETEGRIPADAEHFADYAHFTDRGADVMARILAEGVLRITSASGPE